MTFVIHVGSVLLGTVLDVLPIAVILIVFQVAVIRRRPPNLARAVVGFLYVLVGLALFLVGLEDALFPLGRTMAEQPAVNTEFADTAFRQPRMQAYIEQLQVYTDSILQDTPPPVSGEDGRAGVAAALALLESSRTGKLIDLS